MIKSARITLILRLPRQVLKNQEKTMKVNSSPYTEKTRYLWKKYNVYIGSQAEEKTLKNIFSPINSPSSALY